MIRLPPSLLAIATLLTLLAATTSVADDGNAQRAAASVFRENPRQSDPALELQRLRNEGIALYESGIALDDALTTFRRAYGKSRAAPDAFNVAVVYFKKNDPRASRRWLRRALRADANFPNALYLMGLLARADGKFAEAKRYWERTREVAPDDGHLHYQLALLARGERDQAAFLQSLVNALALEPENTAALYQMSRYYQMSGNRELAGDIWQRFLAIKKREKFSRREKLKDPSRLAQPVLASADEARAFQPIEIAPQFELTLLDPGCPAQSADLYATQSVPVGEDEPERAHEMLLLACRDGRLLQSDLRGSDEGETGPRFLLRGQLPAPPEQLRLEWLDESGARVIALTEAGVAVATHSLADSAAEATEFTQPSPDAQGPLLLIDLDSDGDIDIATGGGALPLTHAGERDGAVQFVREEALYREIATLLDGAIAARVVDLQRDGLSDLLILHRDALVIASSSPSGLGETLRIPLTSEQPPHDLVVADFSNNGWMDVALLGAEGVTLLWDVDPGMAVDAVERSEHHLPAPALVPGAVSAPASEATADERTAEATAVRGAEPAPFIAATASDYNNDGLLDLILLRRSGSASLLRNGGDASAARFTPIPLGDRPAPATDAELLTGDLDRDGREELLYLTADGQLAWLQNRTEGAGASIAIFANGVRAAPSGRLTQFEIRRGGRYAYRQSKGRVIRFGIGDADYVEVLRFEWSNGFIENKLKIDSAIAPYAFTESERISGSCPSLFVWDGERFDYLTDAFISGPMGVPLDRGLYFPVQDRELLLIPGERVALRDGRLDLRFTEELHETVFLDRARLLVVDHPATTQLFPHSRLAPVAPASEPFYTAHALITAARATGSDGSDLTATLATVDQQHADFLVRSRHAGFAEPHWIELELPAAVDPADVDALIATGWFFYFESTSMIAEAQRSGPNLPWPWIQQQIDGEWQDVAPLGLPSGKGKSAVAPLAGQLKSSRLRVRSGISVYWDQIAFSLKSEADERPLAIVEAPLTESTLRFRGFSRLVSRDPELFDYHDVSYAALWSPMGGRFTNYGPAEGLISAADGDYAVFGSGDEISFSFQVEPAPADSARSYLLELVGYVKDGDRYTAHAGVVEPMPYLGLNQYPPPQDERLQAAQERSRFRQRAPLDFTLAVIGPLAESGNSTPSGQDHRGNPELD